MYSTISLPAPVTALPAALTASLDATVHLTWAIQKAAVQPAAKRVSCSRACHDVAYICVPRLLTLDGAVQPPNCVIISDVTVVESDRSASTVLFMKST